MQNKSTIDKKVFSNHFESDWEEKIKKDIKLNDLKSLSWVAPNGITIKPFYHNPGNNFNALVKDNSLIIESRVFESNDSEIHKAIKKASEEACHSLYFENSSLNSLTNILQKINFENTQVSIESKDIKNDIKLLNQLPKVLSKQIKGVFRSYDCINTY